MALVLKAASTVTNAREPVVCNQLRETSTPVYPKHPDSSGCFLLFVRTWQITGVFETIRNAPLAQQDSRRSYHVQQK